MAYARASSKRQLEAPRCQEDGLSSDPGRPARRNDYATTQSARIVRHRILSSQAGTAYRCDAAGVEMAVARWHRILGDGGQIAAADLQRGLT